MNKTMKKTLALVMMTLMLVTSLPMTSFAGNWLCDLTGAHDFAWQVTKAATCQSTGTETEICTRSDCGTTRNTRTINLVGHTEYVIPAAPATCDKDGNTAGKACSVCGYIIEACQTIEKKGHVAVDVPAVDATCTENGKTAGKECSVCHKAISGCTVVVAPGHDLKLTSYKAGSCTTSGEEKYECRNCEFTKTETIEAEHSYGLWSTVEAATCEKTGKMERICKKCGEKDYKNTDKLPHTEISVAAKDATCTEDGNAAGKKCKVCGFVISGCNVIKATGHKEQVVKGTPAACGVKGTTDASYCTVCNKPIKEPMELAALEHIMVKDTAKSKAANCTTEGLDAQKCSRTGCTYTVEKVIPKTHQVNWTVTKAATCTTAGKQSGYCSACKKTVSEDIPATGHTVTNEASWIVTKEATCEKEGSKKATCKTCGQTATKAIPATGHKEVVDKPAQAPTCKDVGYTESTHCSVCKKTMVAATEVAKLAHDFGEWTVVKSATCAAAGVKKATCKVCKEEVTETIKRLDHTEKKTAAIPATCTEDGKTEGIDCSACGATIKAVEVVKALGHDYVEDTTAAKAPTCTEAGKYKGTCSRCKDVKEEELKALGHTEEVIAGTPADCTQSGLSEGKKCTVCGEITVPQTEVAALGHDLKADPSKSTPATCTEKGMDFLACSRCKYTEEKEVAPLDHTWGEWIDVTAPSCEAQGLKRRTCSVCQTVEEQPIDSLGGHEIVTNAGYPATCTEPGKTNGTYCQVCNTVFEAQDDIAPLGHDTEGAEFELIKATTERDGTYALFCKVCNEAVEGETFAKIDEASIKLSTEKCTYNGKTRKPTVTVANVNGVALVEDVDFEVEYPAGRKAVGEYKIKVKFIGNYDGEKELTFTIAAGKTKSVTATSSKKDYVKLSWAAVEGATGYRVYVYKNADSKTRKRIASVEGTTYNLKKDYAGKALKIGSEYKIAIVAYTKLEDGTVIHALAGVAETFTRTAGKPDLSVSSAAGKASLKWTNVEEESGYEIWYSTSKEGTYKKAASVKANVVSYSKSFTKGKTIYFKVRAFTTVDEEPVYGAFSAIKSVKIK